ncbi:MAG: TOBE domain-containing protein [Burkholderiales bacterium]
MKLSARNVLPGKVTEVSRGPTTARVKIQLDGGATVTSSITTEAAEDLKLAAGDKVSAIIKASDVMIGK